MQCGRCQSDRCKRYGGSLGNIEKRVSPVRHVEHPQQAHLKILGRSTPRVPVQSTTTKLWLTLRIEVDEHVVVLKHLDYGKRLRE